MYIPDGRIVSLFFFHHVYADLGPHDARMPCAVPGEQVQHRRISIKYNRERKREAVVVPIKMREAPPTQPQPPIKPLA